MVENLNITKDNYKGYTTLYTKRKEMDEYEQSLEDRIFIVEVLTSIITAILCFVLVPIDFGFLAHLVIALIISFSSVTIMEYVNEKKGKHRMEKVENDVKENFPNIDVNVSMEVLREALIKVNIIKSKEGKEIIDSSQFIKMLEKQEYIAKCEAIKDKMIEENKYSSFDYQTDITEEELEQTKRKVKKYVENG